MEPFIFRTRSPRLVDAFVNHPDVRPTIEAGDERIDSAAVVTDPVNICLCGEWGGALFIPTEPGIFEGHIFLLKGHRGAEGLAFGKAALKAMFGTYEASKVVAKVPETLRGATWYVRRLGFSFQRKDGRGHDVFVMEK